MKYLPILFLLFVLLPARAATRLGVDYTTADMALSPSNLFVTAKTLAIRNVLTNNALQVFNANTRTFSIDSNGIPRDVNGNPYSTNAGGGSATFNSSSTLFVSTNGSDGIAARGNPSLAYRTISAAKTAALNGDEIDIGPGTYTNSGSLAKSGVLGYVLRGAQITFTDPGTGAGLGIFDDRGVGNVTNYITGWGKLFYSTGKNVIGDGTAGVTINPTNSVRGAICLTNANTIFVSDLQEIALQTLVMHPGDDAALGVAAIYIENCAYASIKVNRITDPWRNVMIQAGNDDFGPVSWHSSSIGVYWRLGEAHVNVGSVEAYRYALYGLEVGSQLHTNDFYFSADSIVGAKVYVSAQSPTYRNWLHWNSLDVAAPAAGVAADFFGGHNYLLACGKINGGNGRCVNQIAGGLGEGTLWIDCQKFVSSMSWMSVGTNATIHARVHDYQDDGTAVQAGLINSGGFLDVGQGYAVVTNGTGLTHNGGTTILDNFTIDTSATASAANPPITITTNGLVLGNVKLVGPVQAPSIKANGAYTVEMSGVRANSTNSPLIAVIGTNRFGGIVLDTMQAGPSSGTFISSNGFWVGTNSLDNGWETDPVVLIQRVLLSQPGAGPTNSHSFADATIYARTNKGFAANSFDSRVQVLLGVFMAHQAAFQALQAVGGVVTNVYGLSFAPYATPGGLIVNAIGGEITFGSGGGDVGTFLGMHFPTPSGNTLVEDNAIQIEPRSHGSAYGSIFINDPDARIMMGPGGGVKDLILCRDQTSNGVLQVFIDYAADGVRDTGIKGVDPFGANFAGGTFLLAGGRSTGTGPGGSVTIQTAPPGAAGSTTNALIERMRITPKGTVTFTNGAASTNNLAEFWSPTARGSFIDSNGIPRDASGGAYVTGTVSSASITNAVASIWTNGVPVVSSGATNVNFLYSGTTVTAAAVGNRADVTITASGGSSGNITDISNRLYQVQPYNPATTYLVFLGDSISAWGIYGYPDIVVSNSVYFPQWQGIAYHTNTATAAIGFNHQTTQYTNSVLPNLPAAGGGTNIIVTISFGGNDDNVELDESFYRTNMEIFCRAEKARGHIVGVCTYTPFGNFSETAKILAWKRFNWAINSTNVDFVPDFWAANPDNTYTNIFDVDTTHPDYEGRLRQARVWDESVRLKSKPPMFGTVPFRDGAGFTFRNPGNGTRLSYLDTNGNWSQIKAGPLVYYSSNPYPQNSAIIAQSGGDGSSPTIIVRIVPGMVSYPLWIATTGDIAKFTVDANGEVLAASDVVARGFRALTTNTPPPTSGIGLEAVYSGQFGNLGTYDRDTASTIETHIEGIPVLLNPTNTGNVGIGTNAAPAGAAKLTLRSSGTNNLFAAYNAGTRVFSIDSNGVPRDINLNPFVTNSTGGSGEANVTGEVFTNGTFIGLTHSKAGVTNFLRSLWGGSGIFLTNNGTNIAIAAAAGTGEANVNGEVFTNATYVGLVHSKAGITNFLRSHMGGYGIILTNQGTNIMFAVDPAVLTTGDSTNHVTESFGSIAITNGSAQAGNITLYETNGTHYSQQLGAYQIVSNNVTLTYTNAIPGVVVGQPAGTGTNQAQRIDLTPGQYVTYNGSAYVASNLPASGGGGSQTPIAQDVNYAAFNATNMLKLGLGGSVSAGSQNSELDMFGTNSTGQVEIYRTRTTNSNFFIDNSDNGGAFANVFSLTKAGRIDIPSALVAGGSVIAASFLEAGASSYLDWAGRTRIDSPTADGNLRIANNGQNNFTKLQLGGIDASYPALGRTNGDLVVFGGDGKFSGGSTNRLLVHGGLVVGPPGTVGTITNILTASATLDFPSTAAGAVSDLPITVAGSADGDVVQIGVPSAQLTGLTGDYFGWASNGVVYIRFANNNVVSAQDPASGTFKVIVTKF